MDYFPLLVKGKSGVPDKYKKTCFGCAYNDPEYDPFKRVCCDCGYRKDKDNFYVRGGRLDYKCIECVKKNHNTVTKFLIKEKPKNTKEDGSFKPNFYRLLKYFYQIDGKTFLEKQSDGSWWSSKLSYALEDLRNHVQSQMQDWMHWENWKMHVAKDAVGQFWNLFHVANSNDFDDYWNLSNIVVEDSHKRIEDSFNKWQVEKLICVGCNLELDIKLFRFGLWYSDNCKDCRNKTRNARRSSNPEKYRLLERLREKGKDRTKENARIRKRMRNDPVFKLRCYASAVIKSVFTKPRNESFKKYFPYSIEELKAHIESQFEPWMNWSNWGVYNPETHDLEPKWQLDHIIPKSYFKGKHISDPEFLACWALSNLRPLDARVNILENSRGLNGRGKIIKPIRFTKEDCSNVEITDINELITFKEVK